MHLANIAIWNLGRRPMRSLLTVLGIAAAVGSFVAMIGLSRGIEQSWMNNLRARGTHLLALQKGAVEILTSSINDDLEKEIGRIDGGGGQSNQNMTRLQFGQCVILVA